MFGIKLNGHQALAIASIRGGILESHAALTRAGAALRGLQDSAVLPVASQKLETALAMIRDAQAAVWRQLPYGNCLSCKLIAEVMQECAVCLARGWVTKSEHVELAKELKDLEHPMVRYRGRLITATRDR